MQLQKLSRSVVRPGAGSSLTSMLSIRGLNTGGLVSSLDLAGKRIPTNTAAYRRQVPLQNCVETV